MRKQRTSLRGFTMFEVLLASAILAVAIIGLAQAVVTSQMLTYEGLHNARATSLGEALLEEILALPYADPQGGGAAGPEAGETTRALYDNADDFHGFTEAAGTVSDASATAYPDEYDDFSRSVTAVYGTYNVTGFSAAVTGVTITVTVQDTSGHSWVLTRFVAQPSS